MSAEARKKSLVIGLLSVVALALLLLLAYNPARDEAPYSAPIWWVSLTAPQYPEEAFPDGIRIHFHVDGVFNGCSEKAGTEETSDEGEALNCVHEMDTINHYVGMYPIAAGAPVERAFAPFLLGFLGLMIIGFAIPNARLRTGVVSLGFAVLVGWMYLTFYGEDGIELETTSYISALMTAIDQEAGQEDEEGFSGSGGGLIERLKREMAEVEAEERGEEVAEEADKGEKARLLADLKESYRFTAEKEGLDDWNGSALQVMTWHYKETLGRYFNDQSKIMPMVENLRLAVHVVFVGLVIAMGLVIWGAYRGRGLFYWLMILVPMALPVFFIIDYAAWLWWFGHNLSQMGAFTVKPFMPTVFGQGKVAQFATHSYPYWGFGVIMVMSVLFAAAALTRRLQIKQESADL